MIPPSTTPHMPGISARPSLFITWHVEVPMMTTIWPGSTARAAGAVTCASTFPTATAMPPGSPVHSAASAVREPARVPRAEIGCSSLSAAKLAKPGLSAARKSRDG